MLRLVAFLAALFHPLAALAQCEGTDMIAALPPEERTALLAQAAAEPYPEGLLWQAIRGDTEITLFGTYHFEHERTEAHLERLKPLIAAAELIYLEVSNADQSEFQRTIASDPSIMFITEGATLPDLLGETDWAAFSEQMRARNIPPFMAAKFKPLWAAMMLGIGPCEARNGAREGRGIDARVGDFAAELGNPARSLEDFAALLAMLDSEPMDKQIELIRLNLAWPGDADDLSYTLRRRYLAGQVAATLAFSEMIAIRYGGPSGRQDYARLMDKLLVQRNAAWVDLLMHEGQGRMVFVAAGAGHLPGRDGVLHLLAREGFEITRLPMPPG